MRCVIPLQCETLSHRGVGQLLETVADVRAYTQPDLAVLGAVATMFDGRSRHPREIAADVADRYGARGARTAGAALHPLRRSTRHRTRRSSTTRRTRAVHTAYRALARQVLEAIGLAARDEHAVSVEDVAPW